MPKIWGETVADHKDRLRETIVGETLLLVAERGRADVTMSAIAERVGIGRATLYNYFPDVDHILASYVVGQFDRQHSVLDDRLADVDDPLDQLRIALELVLGYFATTEHRDTAPVGLSAFGPEAQAAVDAATRSFRDRLAGFVQQAVDRGLLRADLDHDFAAEALNHLLAAGRDRVMRNGQAPQEAAELIFRLFVGGAGTPRARRRIAP